MNSRALWPFLAGALAFGCAAGPRLRLEPADGFPVVVDGGRHDPLDLPDRDLAEGMRHLAQALSVPLKPRRADPAEDLRPMLAGLAYDGDASDLLISQYQSWCGQRGALADCEGLISGGERWDIRHRQRLAMAVAMTRFYDGAASYVRESVDPIRLRAALGAMLVWYLGMLVVPEPISKVIAVNLTVAMIAYVGVDTLLALVEGYRRLNKEVAVTWSFEAIVSAGERFGLLVGGKAGRILVLLATWAMARTVATTARFPDPPRWAAAAAAAGRYGFNLQAAVAGGVRTVMVAGPALTLTLAPGVLAMQGKHGHTVYTSHDAASGNMAYAGITNNFARRMYEQLRARGLQIEKLMTGLPREDARAVEQALIEIHGLQKNGGTLTNRINSIAQSNPIYSRSVQRGFELLRSIGYTE